MVLVMTIMVEWLWLWSSHGYSHDHTMSMTMMLVQMAMENGNGNRNSNGYDDGNASRLLWMCNRSPRVGNLLADQNLARSSPTPVTEAPWSTHCGRALICSGETG